jgi:tetratricopeptide (TPR) repeat protein
MLKKRLQMLLLICCALFLGITAAGQQPQTVAEHMRAGIAAQISGKNEEALQHYAAVINLEPKNFGAQFNSGIVYLELRNWQAAVHPAKSQSAPRG